MKFVLPRLGADAGSWFRFYGGQLSRPIVIPTAAEFRLLEILWVLEEGTIEDLLRASEDGRLNYKTVQTVLRIMEHKRLVSHSIRGRALFIDRG